MSELTRLATSPLATQARDSRLEITIDGVPTYWRRPLSAVVPAFLTFTRGPRAYLQLWHAKESVLLQFVRNPGDRWAFFRSVSEPAAVVQALPFSAFLLPEGEAPASTAQLDALRRMLQLPVDHPLPSLHSYTATRLLNRLLLEPALVRLRAEHINARLGAQVSTPKTI